MAWLTWLAFVQFSPSRQGSPVLSKAAVDNTNGANKVPDIINVLEAKADEL